MPVTTSGSALEPLLLSWVPSSWYSSIACSTFAYSHFALTLTAPSPYSKQIRIQIILPDPNHSSRVYILLAVSTV